MSQPLKPGRSSVLGLRGFSIFLFLFALSLFVAGWEWACLLVCFVVLYCYFLFVFIGFDSVVCTVFSIFLVKVVIIIFFAIVINVVISCSCYLLLFLLILLLIIILLSLLLVLLLVPLVITPSLSQLSPPSSVIPNSLSEILLHNFSGCAVSCSVWSDPLMHGRRRKHEASVRVAGVTRCSRPRLGWEGR